MPFARAATPRRSSSRGASRRPRPARPIARVPAQATPCVGRGREIAQLTGLLADPGVRLVTMTGAGGMGKTRLALAVAQQLVDDISAPAGATAVAPFPDGVFFVALAPINEAAQLAPTTAAALSFRPGPAAGRGGADEQLRDYLAGKRLLLVLDNFEQLAGKGTDEGAGEGAAWLAELLGAAPGSRRWSPHASRWICRRSNGIRSRGWPCLTWKPSCPTSRWTGRTPSPFLCRWRGGCNTASG